MHGQHVLFWLLDLKYIMVGKGPEKELNKTKNVDGGGLGEEDSL